MNKKTTKDFLQSRRYRIVPNFFILGAPKCGTTSLAQYLSTHPNIFMCPGKEPNFFNTDMPTFSLAYDLKDYLRLFKEAKKHHIIVGESTTNYLSSKNAVKGILSFNPNAKFIVLLRSPIDMFFSLHAQLCRVKVETILDPKKAWAVQHHRNLPRYSRPYKQVLSYKKKCSLGEQVSRLLNTVSNKNNVKFILFDDLQNDTKKVYSEVLKFLSLPIDERKNFPIANKHMVLQKKFSAYFFSNVLYFFRWIKTATGKNRLINNSIVGKFQHVFIRFYEKHCLKVENRPLPDEEFVDELKLSFYEDVMLLSKLLNKDLSKWVK